MTRPARCASRTRSSARAQVRVLGGTPWTLKQRTQSGKRYWVREHIRIDGAKTDEYLGPVAALPDARVAELRAEIELARSLAAASADTTRALAASSASRTIRSASRSVR